MFKAHLVAAVLAGGLLVLPVAHNAPLLPTSSQPAGAVPLAKVDIERGAGVVPVKRERRAHRGHRGGKKFHRGGKRKKYGRRGGGRKHYRDRGPRFGGWYGARPGYYYHYYPPYLPPYYRFRSRSYGFYLGGCEWLRERAIYSGRSYWWRRYDRCRLFY